MRYLGLDLGKKSLGISLSDKLGLIASFYKNIKSDDEEELIETARRGVALGFKTIVRNTLPSFWVINIYIVT